MAVFTALITRSLGRQRPASRTTMASCSLEITSYLHYPHQGRRCRVAGLMFSYYGHDFYVGFLAGIRRSRRRYSGQRIHPPRQIRGLIIV